MREKSVNLHILLISFIFSPNIGGVESHLDDLCAFLTSKGHNITVITYQPLLASHGAPSFEKKGKLEIRRIPWLKFNLFNRLESIPLLQFLYLVPAILFYSAFFLLRKRKQIDVIQVHGFNMAIVGAILTLIFRVPLVINTHVSFYLNPKTLYTKILTFVLQQARGILVLTHEAKKELEKLGIKKEKITIYHQWIDTKLFNPKNKSISRKRFNLSRDTFVVCFAGRLIYAKGIHLLLDAAKHLDPGVVISFVGSGELKKEIITQSKKNSAMKFIGQIKRSDLPFYYSGADICIIPSTPATTTYSEGIPRVMIEAFTCGVPVIASKTGGVSELLKNDVGFFMEPNGLAIARAINKLAKNRKKIEKMQKNCILYAKEQFDFKANAYIIEKSLMI